MSAPHPPDIVADDAVRLLRGEPPASPALLRYLSWPRWVEFLRREYLEGYLAGGGAKVKLLVGTVGSGKSHQLALALDEAREAGYLTARADARAVERAFPLDRLYTAILRDIDLGNLVQRLCAPLIGELGYGAEELPGGQRFLEWVERERGVPRAPLERRLFEALGKIARDSGLDLTFGAAMSQLAAHHIGLLTLNEAEEDALRRWFLGEKVSLTELRPLRIYRRVDRHTARSFLRSLVEVALRAGYRGLVVGVDNLDVLLERHPETGRLRYTRAARDEAYEAIRELIDDVDEARALLFLFAGRRAVLEDEKAGVSSYEALRLRLLPEVRSRRFNPFADIVDLDAARVLGYLAPADLNQLADRAAALAPPVRQALEGVEPPPPPVLAGLREVILTRLVAAHPDGRDGS